MLYFFFLVCAPLLRKFSVYNFLFACISPVDENHLFSFRDDGGPPCVPCFISSLVMSQVLMRCIGGFLREYSFMFLCVSFSFAGFRCSIFCGAMRN